MTIVVFIFIFILFFCASKKIFLGDRWKKNWDNVRDIPYFRN